MDNNYKKLFEEYYNSEYYIIKDIVNKNNKYIFILESPHNNEIECGYPVAGESGQDMRKFLEIDSKESFGKYVNDNPEAKISIINVSRVPLQIINSLEKKYINVIDEVCSIVRCGYDSFGKHRKKYINEIEKIILDDFKRRLKELELDMDTNIIICGNFARVYFENTIDCVSGINKDNILYVPHPSRKQWISNKNDLDKLYDGFKKDYKSI